MRLLFAGIFVWAGVCLVILLILLLCGMHWNSVVMGLGMAVLIFILAGIAHRFFNKNGGAAETGDTAEYLREKGLLTPTVFQARRTFQMEEIEDEGSYFFIELESGFEWVKEWLQENGFPGTLFRQEGTSYVSH